MYTQFGPIDSLMTLKTEESLLFSPQLTSHVLHPMEFANSMLCSQEWLAETQDPDEMPLFPVHVERKPSVAIDTDFRDGNAALDMILEHDQFQDFHSADGLFEDGGAEESYHELSIIDSSVTLESYLQLPWENGIPGHEDIHWDRDFEKDPSTLAASPNLQDSKLPRHRPKQISKRATTRKSRKSRVRRQRSSRSGCVRAEHVQLSYDHNSSARIRSIQIERGPDSGEYTWDRRAKSWRGIKDSREKNAEDFLKPEMRSTLSLTSLVSGAVVPPAFHWIETEQMFICTDEVIWERAFVSENDIHNMILDGNLSTKIDWKKVPLRSSVDTGDIFLSQYRN